MLAHETRLYKVQLVSAIVFTNDNRFSRDVPNHGRRHGGGGRWVLGPKITLIIRFVQQGNLVPHVTSHREILYGPLYGALRCDIFPIFMAISLH